MDEEEPRSPEPGEVAMWHRLSGQPDNVTDEGEIIDARPGMRLQSDKELLRTAVARLSAPGIPPRVRGTARLAGSYLLAGDVDTARRTLQAAEELLAQLRPPD
jgi:hypothetical protein